MADPHRRPARIPDPDPIADRANAAACRASLSVGFNPHDVIGLDTVSGGSGSWIEAHRNAPAGRRCTGMITRSIQVAARTAPVP